MAPTSLGNKKSVPKWGQHWATLDYRRRHASNASPPSAARISVDGSGTFEITTRPRDTTAVEEKLSTWLRSVRSPVAGSIDKSPPPMLMP